MRSIATSTTTTFADLNRLRVHSRVERTRRPLLLPRGQKRSAAAQASADIIGENSKQKRGIENPSNFLFDLPSRNRLFVHGGSLMKSNKGSIRNGKSDRDRQAIEQQTADTSQKKEAVRQPAVALKAFESANDVAH
jgi:hypothetical protein